MERVKTRCGAACRDDCRLPVPPAPSGPAAGNTVLGGGKNPLRSAKNPLRGAKNPGATPRFGARKTRFGARKNCPGGGVPLGCPPSNFRRIFVEFSSNFRRIFVFVLVEFFLGFSVWKKFSVEFSSNFRRIFVAVPRPPPAVAPRGAPRPPPAALPLGLGLLPSPEGAVRGPNPSAPGGPS